ncbi:MAG: hypothetical protein II674_06770, partial [Prevotella sp.]|nr:hypothetical protein [Prevotella sp.]
KSFGITSPFFCKGNGKFRLGERKGRYFFFQGAGCFWEGLGNPGRDWETLGGTGIFWEGIIMDDVYAMLF